MLRAIEESEIENGRRKQARTKVFISFRNDYEDFSSVIFISSK
jgi:hypothetical protein